MRRDQRILAGGERLSVCPFCKAPVTVSHGPCPRCGKVASDHPSIAGTGGRNLGDDFGDDIGGPGLELGTGSAHGGIGSGATSYGSDEGMSFDDDLDGGHSGPLELDMPSAPHSSPASSGEHVVSPPHSSPTSSQHPRISGSHPAASISGTQPSAAPYAAGSGRPPQSLSNAPVGPPTPRSLPVPVALPPPRPKLPPTPAEMIAKYPAAPGEVWRAPGYAWKVLYRQLEIRQDLDSLKKRRSPDAPLYEAALRAHDKKTFLTGMAISAAAFVVAMLIFFIPVFLRFLRAD